MVGASSTVTTTSPMKKRKQWYVYYERDPDTGECWSYAQSWKPIQGQPPRNAELSADGMWATLYTGTRTDMIWVAREL